MRNWRASQPRGRTAPSGSGSNRSGASGARFFTACAEAASKQKSAADNTAMLRMVRTVDSLYISICHVAFLRPLDRNAAQQEAACGDLVEIHRAEQHREFSR